MLDIFIPLLVAVVGAAIALIPSTALKPLGIPTYTVGLFWTIAYVANSSVHLFSK